MADNNEQTHNYGDIHQVAMTANNALEIAMPNENDLQGLNNVLKKFFKEIEKQKEDTDSNNKSNGNKIINAVKELQKETAKQNNDLLKALENENKKDIGKNFFDRLANNKNLLLKTLDITSKALANVSHRQLQYAATLKDLSVSGVRLGDGFRALDKEARDAGMTYMEYSQHLTKFGSTIAHLNGIMGNGSKLISQSFETLRKQQGLTASESHAVMDSVFKGLSASQIAEMQAHGELQNYIAKTSANLKKMSNGLGESIEMITRDNDIKKQSLQIQLWSKANVNNSQSLQALRGLGFDSDTIQSLITGIPSAKVAMQMASSSSFREVFKGIQNQLNAGGVIDDAFITEMKKRYMSDWVRDEQNVKRLGKNKGILAASGNETFANQFGWMSIMDNIMKYDINKPSAEDTKVVKNINDIAFNVAQMQNKWDETLRGGFEGTQSALNTINSTLNIINSSMQSIIPSNNSALMGAGASMFAETMPYVIGNAISGVFGKTWNFGKHAYKRGFGRTIKTLSNVGMRNGIRISKGALTGIKNISQGAWSGTKNILTSALTNKKKIAALGGLTALMGSAFGPTVAFKQFGKKIPGIGFGISAYDAYNRYKNGDKFGAVLDIASGIASTIPGGGTYAATALDAINMGRDALSSPNGELVTPSDGDYKQPKQNNNTDDNTITQYYDNTKKSLNELGDANKTLTQMSQTLISINELLQQNGYVGSFRPANT